MPAIDLGEEWIIDAFGCDPSTLRDAVRLQHMVQMILADMSMRALGDGFWHTFEGPGGVTGLVPLQESHFSLHTYPEYGVATINLYCCRSGRSWDWERGLNRILGAVVVNTRCLARGRAPEAGLGLLSQTSANGMAREE